MNRLISTLLFLLGGPFLFAQGVTCYDFEAPELSGTYGASTGLMPGDVAFELGNIPVALAPILYLNGDEGFMDLHIDDAIFGDTEPLAGQSVFMGNLSMVLDFTALDAPVTEVCFEFFDGGGVENLGVNDQPALPVAELAEIDPDALPGFALSFLPEANVPNAGKFCISGPLEKLTIGGQEFGLDNLCVITATAECSLDELVVQPQPCTPNGIFYVDLSFAFDQVGNEGYTIQGNGQNYGNFSYDEPFPEIGPFTGDGDTVYELEIIDLENPDCRIGKEFGPVDCDSDCELTNLAAYINECGIQNAPYLYVDFDHQNINNQGFELYLDNDFFGAFSYDDLPLLLDDFPVNDLETVKVCADDQPGCCATAQVELIDCDPDSCITFSALEVGEAFGADTGFAAGDTAFVEAGVPVTLDSFYYFDGSAGFWGIEVTDNSFDNFDLAEGNHLFVSNINLNFDFSDLEGQVVSLCFDFFDGGGEENIAVNGETVEVVNVLTEVPFELAPGITFSLDLEPSSSDFIQFGTACLTGPLESLTLGGQEFAVDNFCFSTFQPGTDCELYDLIVEPYDCADGEFFIDLAFESENTGEEGFQVFIGDEVFGPFDYEEPFVTIGPLPAANTAYSLLVKDVAHPDCQISTEFGPVDCPGDDCVLSDGEILEVACANDGSFSLTFDFSFQGAGDGFYFTPMGNVNEPISYEELPYTATFGPNFPLAGELMICDAADDNCCLEIPYEVDCFGCSFDALVLEPGECDADGFFYVTLDLEGDELGDTFKLFIENSGFEVYAYEELPIQLGPFFGDGQHPTHFMVEDETGGCAIDGELPPVFCDDNCTITSLVVEPYDCEDGDFLIEVEVTALHPGPLGYYVFVDGEIFGPFSYDETFVTLGPFPGDPDEVYDILALDIANPACYAYQEIGPIDCTPEECEIFGLAADPLDCNLEDNTYELYLNFEYAFPGNDFFDLFVNGQLFDFFVLAELPLIIDGIPVSNSAETEIKVCINDQPDCCKTVVIATPDCDGDQIVWPGDTDSDNIARHFDLLHLGLAYGATGPARANANIVWDGMPAEAWSSTFPNGVNYAHGDCNGDGEVDALDRAAIEQNYGLTHGAVEPYIPPVASPDDPPIKIDFPGVDPIPGGADFEAPVVVGTPNQPVEDLYGIAFTIVFDPEIIAPNSVYISYTGSWFGLSNVNALTIDRSFAADGRIEVALTRIDGESVSGSGALCMIGGIIDDIAGMAESVIYIEKPKAIRIDGDLIPLRTPEETFEVISKTDSAVEAPSRPVRVFPNPFSTQLTVELPQDVRPDRLVLIDGKGREVVSPSLDGSGQLSLADLPAGLYWLQVHMEGQIVNKRVVKLRH